MGSYTTDRLRQIVGRQYPAWGVRPEIGRTEYEYLAPVTVGQFVEVYGCRRCGGVWIERTEEEQG
ncbi:MAG: zf-TFIIB domain-containing protein [Planctomycetales bacterium]|nr:zf-TFIIB domain-containing protein [Planctomycetales bacterium]